MAKRQVFFSFRFLYDAWRAGQIRSMGKVSDDSTFSDNDWETVRSKSDSSIEKWIKDQMKMRSCVVVLIGEHTSGRKWINYEIKQAWLQGKGVVGIRIHGLKDEDGEQAEAGDNPFDTFLINTKKNDIRQYNSYIGSDEEKLTDVCKTYNPPYKASTNVYKYIEDNIADWIEEAIEIRNKYPK